MVPAIYKFQETVLKRDPADVKALLLWDNAPCHPINLVSECGKIRTKFLPKNTTSILQPADQGQIAAFKRLYRKRQIFQCLDVSLLDESVEVDNRGENSLKKIKDFNIRDAVHVMIEAWNDVSQETLKNCWKKLLDDKLDSDVDVDNNNDVQDAFPDVWSEEELSNWLDCDRHEEGVPDYSEQDIIDEVLNASCDNCGECDDIDSIDSEPPPNKMSRDRKLQLIGLLNEFSSDLEHDNLNETYDIYNGVQKIRSHLLQSLTVGLKQLKITNFVSGNKDTPLEVVPIENLETSGNEATANGTEEVLYLDDNYEVIEIIVKEENSNIGSFDSEDLDLNEEDMSLIQLQSPEQSFKPGEISYIYTGADEGNDIL